MDKPMEGVTSEIAESCFTGAYCLKSYMCLYIFECKLKKLPWRRRPWVPTGKSFSYSGTFLFRDDR